MTNLEEEIGRLGERIHDLSSRPMDDATYRDALRAAAQAVVSACEQIGDLN